jgi:hypothetical protein
MNAPVTHSVTSDVEIPVSKEPRTTTFSFSNGYALGKYMITFCEKYWRVMFITILVIVLIFFMVESYKALSSKKKRNPIDVFNGMFHLKCKQTGGCCSSCPFIQSSDPRVSIKEHSSVIESIKILMDDLLESEQQLKIKHARKIGETAYKKIETEVNGYLSNQKKYYKLLLENNTLASTTSALRKNDAQITLDSVKDNNRITGLESASLILHYAFIGNMGACRSLLYKTEIGSDVLMSKKDKVYDYESKEVAINTSLSNVKLLAKELDEQTSMMTQTVADLKNSTDDAVITKAMVTLGNLEASMKEKLITLTTHADAIAGDYKTIVMKVDSFSNDLPGKIGTDEVSNMIARGDWDTALIRTALEPEIVSNHQKFAKERASFDSGGGVPSVRDDDNDVVKWVGLFGRPTYRRSNGTSADIGAEPLRSIPSDDPNDLMRTNTPRLSLA